MLTIALPETELFDEKAGEFRNYEALTIELEHSLVSLSKWESITHKPFMGKGEKTSEELLLYVKCMTITPGVPDETYVRLTEENFTDIYEYLNNKMSATWFTDTNQPGSREVITSELIYYWMIELNIPFECETWHLNRLFTLIRIVNTKRQPAKKMSRREVAARQHALNEQRRQQLGTRG
jgi:hypothetical protein